MPSAKRKLKAFRIRFEHWQERLREPGLSAVFVIEVLLLFIVTPFVGMGWLPSLASRLTLILFILATLVVTARSYVATAVVLVAVILAAAAVYVHVENPTLLTELMSAGGRLLAIGALSVVIARAVFGPGRVTFYRVQGAVVLYMNFALFFFSLYHLLAVLVPGTFHGLPQSGSEHGSGATLLYFSFTTLTTAGFGDIVPVHPLARNLANLEAMIGQLYPATLLARLVSLEIQHRGQQKSQ